MRQITLLLILILVLGNNLVFAQKDINQSDMDGRKQGRWLKKHPNGKTLYEGFFENDRPVGEFKRYNEKGHLTSVQIYNINNDTVLCQFFHTNKFKSAEGIYIGRKKTGVWNFYSRHIEDHLLLSENYENDIKEGPSTKYHWDGKVAEELIYKSDKKDGVWKQYFSDGVICIHSQYKEGRLNGKFNSYHLDGKPEIDGQYKNDIREGKWLFYNRDGSLKREIIYHKGIAENRAELIKEETEYLDRLERESGKIQDPEKTGFIKL